MNKTNDGGPAFPVEDVPENYFGMTLRDYFAAKAMQGLFAAGGGVTRDAEEWARIAYAMADAMLKVREM